MVPIRPFPQYTPCAQNSNVRCRVGLMGLDVCLRSNLMPDRPSKIILRSNSLFQWQPRTLYPPAIQIFEFHGAKGRDELDLRLRLAGSTAILSGA